MEGYHRDGRLDDYFAINGEIHATIVRLARNVPLREAHETLLSRAERARYLALGAERRWSNSVDEHAAILAALEARDGEAGRAPPADACAAHRHGAFGSACDIDAAPATRSAMNILLLNPNTSADVTDLMLGVGQRVAAPGTTLIPCTAPRGVPYIATRAEAQIGGAIALEMLAERHREVDAAIIAAFGDPGLFAAQRTVRHSRRRHGRGRDADGLHGGTTLCDRHVRAGARSLVRGMRSRARAVGAMCRHPHARRSVRDRCQASRPKRKSCWLNSPSAPIAEDDADVLIFAGAPLSGLAERVADRIPVPVIDQVVAAVKQVEALLALRLRKATAGTFRRPDAKPTTGLADALARRIEHRDT